MQSLMSRWSPVKLISRHKNPRLTWQILNATRQELEYPALNSDAIQGLKPALSLDKGVDKANLTDFVPTKPHSL